MALKERKQITGTTSQINAYAGHEGQVVWDKSKKTLVGMSGTAGTIYPLATQEYADNKVSQLEGKVDASNAAFTEALNKKENAGVCLPLVGGDLVGPLFLAETNHIWAVVDETLKGLELGGGSTFENGASLFLRNNNATGPEESGQWGLAAHKATSEKEGLLIGRTDNIWFNGKVVERADGFYAAQFDGGYCDVHRYVTGLQIVTAGITIPANQLGVTLTFTRPFINNAYSIAASGITPFGDLAITWDSDTTTSIKLYRKTYTGSYDFDTYTKCVFIGRWL